MSGSAVLFTGNSDQSTPVTNELPVGIQARYIRVVVVSTADGSSTGSLKVSIDSCRVPCEYRTKIYTVASTLSGTVIIADRCLSTDSLLCVSNGLISDVEASSNRGSETAEASCAMDESVTEGTILVYKLLKDVMVTGQAFF